jgi:hypothetical protein
MRREQRATMLLAEFLIRYGRLKSIAGRLSEASSSGLVPTRALGCRSQNHTHSSCGNDRSAALRG